MPRLMRVLCVGILCVDTGSYATSYAACLLRVLCAHLVREPGLEFSVACSLPRKCLMRGLMRLMRGSCAASPGFPWPSDLARLMRGCCAKVLCAKAFGHPDHTRRPHKQFLRRMSYACLMRRLMRVLCALTKSYAVLCASYAVFV